MSHYIDISGRWNGASCLGKLQDTGSRENRGCAGLTVSRKLPTYVWKYGKEILQHRKKKWRMLLEEKTLNREGPNVK
jgi:hypothetical protein